MDRLSKHLPWGYHFSVLAGQKLQIAVTSVYLSQLNFFKKWSRFTSSTARQSGFYPYISLRDFPKSLIISVLRNPRVLYLPPLKHTAMLTTHSLAKTTHHSPFISFTSSSSLSPFPLFFLSISVSKGVPQDSSLTSSFWVT